MSMSDTRNITEIIKARRSCRSYTDQVIDAGMKSRINQFIGSMKTGPFGNSARFVLMDDIFSGEHKDMKLGTYGVIRGADNYLAGAITTGEGHLEDYGYLMENIVLFLTENGLGTCWLGGFFNRSEFSRVLGIKPDEVVPAVTPVGYASPKISIVDRVIRRGAGSDSRKPREELFFEDDPDTPLTADAAGKYGAPLEMLRLGPSASNKQPWRVIKEKGRNNYRFYLKRSAGYSQLYKALDLQKLDIGIAMSHFDLTAKELPLPGHWEVEKNAVNAVPGMEYIVSWVG
jgi:nitroreductase